MWWWFRSHCRPDKTTHGYTRRCSHTHTGTRSITRTHVDRDTQEHTQVGADIHRYTRKHKRPRKIASAAGTWLDAVGTWLDAVGPVLGPTFHTCLGVRPSYAGTARGNTRVGRDTSHAQVYALRCAPKDVRSQSADKSLQMHGYTQVGRQDHAQVGAGTDTRTPPSHARAGGRGWTGGDGWRPPVHRQRRPA